MSALVSKQMLKMSSFGTNTRTQMFAPLINNYCVIDDVLSQAMPHIDKTLLQFIQVVNFCLVDPQLHFAPYLVVHWVKMWTVEGHRCGSMNADIAGVSHSRSLIVSHASSQVEVLKTFSVISDQ